MRPRFKNKWGPAFPPGPTVSVLNPRPHGLATEAMGQVPDVCSDHRAACAVRLHRTAALHRGSRDARLPGHSALPDFLRARTDRIVCSALAPFADLVTGPVSASSAPALPLSLRSLR
jgi:hypothetical protein